jgi:hypothetical protein
MGTNTFLLHAAAWKWSQTDRLEGAEENKEDCHVLIGSCHPSSGTQYAIEKEQWSRLPNITPACDIHVRNMIEFLLHLLPLALK